MTKFLRQVLILLSFALTAIAGAQVASTTSPAQIIALENVTLINGDGAAPRPKMTVVISADRIADIFETGSKHPPAGAQLIDLSGHYLIPGLIDSHYHLTMGRRSKEADAALRRYAFLGGVTTVRDMAGDAIVLAELAKPAADPKEQSPRIHFSALFAGPSHILGDKRADEVSHGLPRGEAPWARSITPESDIPKVIAQAKETGATGIKLYSDLSLELVTRLADEARKQGMRVWGHASIYPCKPSDAVRAGVEVLSHSNLFVPEAMSHVPEKYAGSYPRLDYSVAVESKAISDLLRQMREKGTILDPTLLVQARLARTKPGEIFQDPQRMAQWSNQFTLRAHILKIPMVAGTDIQENPAANRFPNIHRELELLVSDVGLTPLEAITAATRNGARVLGISDDLGTIERGKIADLVVLWADPTADIKNTTSIVYVIKGGTIHKRNSGEPP